MNPIAKKSGGSGRLRAFFRHDQRFRDLSYSVEVSNDLTSWTPICQIVNAARTNLEAAVENITVGPPNQLDLEIIDSVVPAP